VAVFLVRNGSYDLAIIEGGNRIGRDVNPFYLWQYVRLLKGSKVVLMARAKVLGMDGDRLRISGSQGEKTIDVDGIILAEQESAKLWDPSLAGEIYYIGDAKQPRRINNAIHDGYRMGMNI
jgi:2,4-dienoyl-CoA reductase (NADPH2)